MACPLDNLVFGQLVEFDCLGHLCEVCGYVSDRHVLGMYRGLVVRSGTPTHIFLDVRNYKCPGRGSAISNVNIPCGGITHEAFKEVESVEVDIPTQSKVA